MSRETDDYGLMYEDDPILGKTLTTIGALAPWFVCVIVIAPMLIAAGAPWYLVLMIMPWVGTLLSMIWINVNL